MSDCFSRSFDAAPVVGVEFGVVVVAVVVEEEGEVGDFIALSDEHFFVEGADLVEGVYGVLSAYRG